MNHSNLITLTTDFGWRDSYVAEMKGVILSCHPEARIVDISHDIKPQDIDEAAWVLERAYRHFPPRTIHVVVIDPGVGSERAVLGVKTKKYLFLAPDNGVLKMIFHHDPEPEVIRITNDSYFLKVLSSTFHGRDIFAPVAAALSKGTSISSLGEVSSDFIRGEVPVLTRNPNRVTGEIVYVDGFGNGMTNIGRDDIIRTEKTRIRIESLQAIPLVNTFTDVAEGQPLAYIGSYGTVEIAVRNGNARILLAYHKGDHVTVEW